MRTFIAADVGEKKVFETLLSNPFFSSRCVRSVRPSNLHYTLTFIGEIDRPRIPSISDALDRICRTHSSFDVVYTGMDIFGSPGRPRVLWVRVEDMGEIAAIGKEITSSLTRLEVSFDRRELKPHVTLARFSCIPDREALQFLLSEYGEKEFARENVKQISIKRSITGRNGVEYETLHESYLGP
jgi:2'-5' RNA ligase